MIRLFLLFIMIYFLSSCSEKKEIDSNINISFDTCTVNFTCSDTIKEKYTYCIMINLKFENKSNKNIYLPFQDFFNKDTVPSIMYLLVETDAIRFEPMNSDPFIIKPYSTRIMSFLSSEFELKKVFKKNNLDKSSLIKYLKGNYYYYYNYKGKVEKFEIINNKKIRFLIKNDPLWGDPANQCSASIIINNYCVRCYCDYWYLPMTIL